MTYAYKSASDQQTVVPDGLPVALRANLVCSSNSATLDITLATRSRDILENVSVDFVAGPGVSGANCTVSAGSKWAFDPRESVSWYASSFLSADFNLLQLIRWDIASVTPSSTHSFKCSFASREVLRPHRSVIIKFQLTSRSFSPLKVDQLKLSGESYKTYKGIRSSGRGVVEWRL
jgi:AP-3 complex subunit mu